MPTSPIEPSKIYITMSLTQRTRKEESWLFFCGTTAPIARERPNKKKMCFRHTLKFTLFFSFPLCFSLLSKHSSKLMTLFLWTFQAIVGGKRGREGGLYADEERKGKWKWYLGNESNKQTKRVLGILDISLHVSWIQTCREPSQILVYFFFFSQKKVIN